MKTTINIILVVLVLTSPTLLAAQCVSGNCEDGQGTFEYQDNTVYVGSFKNGKADGYGVCYYGNKDKYVGEWKNHTFHGKGTMYTAQGEILDGLWEAGELITKTQGQTTPKHQPKIWAVVVGVADYTSLKSLNYTDDDAYRMYSFLKSPEGGAVPDEQIRLLIDDSATKKKIVTAIHEVFSKANEEDIVFFYFSGHGLKEAFLPSDFDGTQNKVFHKEIVALLDQSKAKHKICIVDACHAGGIANLKSGADLTASKLYQAFEQSAGGTVFIVSSKQEESSIEDRGLRQGIFTHFLIKALRGLADKDGNEVVTVKEAFQYIETNVTAYTNNYQTPIIYGQYDENMPISVLR